MNKESSVDIIKECLDLNIEIIDSYKRSKLPRFITKILEKNARNKIIKSAKKLYTANIPFDKNDLIKLAEYMSNSFPPNGEYKAISRSIITKNKIELRVDTENVMAMIYIDTNKDEFELKVWLNDASKAVDGITAYNVFLVKLKNNKEVLKDYVDEINIAIWKTISDYIIENLESFNKEV